MSESKSRRELYAESTRSELLETGKRLFLERGYTAVSAEELVRAAGLSRGALYHHFEGKQGLFEAVFVELEQHAADRIAAAFAAETDPWQQALAAIRAFLDVCTEHEYSEIVLRQGPPALGWARQRELDQQYLGDLLNAGVQGLLDAGLIQPHPAQLIAATVFGALAEASLFVAEAEDPAAAREQAEALAVAIMDGLAVT
jgi:AcrR family transcriptional regulator